MRQRVLLISNMWPSVAHPGYGSFVARCACGLQRDGIDVQTAVMGRHHGVWRKLLAYLRFAWRANRALLAGRHDCVWLHQPLHTLLASLPGLWFSAAPLVLSFHGHDLLPVTRRGRFLHWLLRAQFARAQRVLVPSARFKRVFDARFKAPAVAFPSGGVAAPHFEAAPLLATRPCSVLFLSRWVQGKGWPDFIDIAARLSAQRQDFSFTLAGGGGVDAARIRHRLHQLGLSARVQVVDSNDARHNAALMGSHRYFVMPSSFDESLALVNLEAMASGCVVLSRNFAAAGEYLQHGVNGFVFGAAEFIDSSVATILRLEGDLPHAQAIAGAARISAMAYAEPAVMARLPALLGLAVCP